MKHFIETEYSQVHKNSQPVPGDTFLSERLENEGRLICILSDGLGSGIKAQVLSTLTASMAMRFRAGHHNIAHTARLILSNLPVCRTRQIQYATFTIVDIDHQNRVQIMEYDNPPALIIRNGSVLETESKSIPVPSAGAGRVTIRMRSFQARPEDRLVLLSDGVTQSGMGSRQFPFGWGSDASAAFICQKLQEQPQLSARNLARHISSKALAHDRGKACDDISAAVLYFRKPRKLLVLTGPPYARERDAELAANIRSFEGNCVICGGTTANIVSRELDRPLEVNIRDRSKTIPPSAKMEGIALVTEGTITLGRVTELLEERREADSLPRDPARHLLELFLEHDQIDFLVGTRVNQAHQDPYIPVELEIRRNIVKKIAACLEKGYLKKTGIQYI